MVNVDELNEEIKQFGNVVEKMNELPLIYEKVQEQLDACRNASNEMKLAREDIENFASKTRQELEHQHNDMTSKITSIETNMEQKFDKMELNIRDRIALAESNITLSLNELKNSVEKSATEINQKLDTEAAINKKRFLVLGIGLSIVIILGVIRFFV